MFEDITAPNPRLNATRAQGHDLQSRIIAASISTNPRLYANKSGGTGFEVPELASQDNSDLPAWATNFADGSTLDSMAVPEDTPVYLQVWIVERQNFYDVAQVQVLVQAGVPLDQALS
jgi:hypothetical protein